MKQLIKLTEAQVKFLKIFSGLKAFARKEALAREFKGAESSIEAELLNLKLLKRNKAGALSGPSWEDCQALIAFSTLSLADLEAELLKRKETCAAEVARDQRLQREDAQYCFYQREILASITYSKNEIERLNALIEKIKRNEQGGVL